MFNEFRSDRKDGVINVHKKDRARKTLLMNYLEHGVVEIQAIRDLINAGSDTRLLVPQSDENLL